MDIDSLLKQLHQNLDDTLQHLRPEGTSRDVSSSEPHYCPFCGEPLEGEVKFCPFCGEELPIDKAIKPLYKLPHYEELEETTKSKIGTFEKLYEQIYYEETHRPLVDTFGSGFDALDYAPLVNPLTSALEIELTHCVYHPIRRHYGNRTIHTPRKTVDLSQGNPSLRDIQSCILFDISEKRVLSLQDEEGCAKALDPIIDTRNAANHTKRLNADQFYKLYENVYHFFDHYLKDLLKTKRAARKSNLSVFGKESLSSLALAFSSSSSSSETPVLKEGILLTNTAQLSLKLFGSKMVRDGENGMVEGKRIVHNLLMAYMEEMSKRGFVYSMLDFDEENSELHWQDCAKRLSEFRRGNRMSTGASPLFLFIVGGHDVIPMPRVLNPFYTEEGEYVGLQNVFEKELESDMLYAYYDDTLLGMGTTQRVDPQMLIEKKPNYYVGRLPLEEGMVDSNNPACSPFDEFYGYFARVVQQFFRGEEVDGALCEYVGLEVGKHVATVCQSSQLVAKDIFQDMPLALEGVHPVTVSNCVHVSPDLNLDELNEHSVTYMKDIDEADLLTFVLHGGCRASTCDYYGENSEKTQQVLGFTTQLMRSTPAQVVAGLCCWGARYIGYSRAQSILLSAMYSNTLLFMGSCRSARGVFDMHIQQGYGITLAEKLLKYYLEDLLSGTSAGEALERSKRKYLMNPDTQLDDVLATILEFNLYGDPMLFLSPLWNREEEEELGVPEENTFHPARKCSFQKENSLVYAKDTNLSEYVRHLVDCNIQEVRSRITDQLYRQFGMNPEELSTIHMREDETGARFLRLTYSQDFRYFQQQTFIDTDLEGHVKHIVGNL